MNAAWLLITDDGGAAFSSVNTKNRRVMFQEVTNLGLADLAARPAAPVRNDCFWINSDVTRYWQDAATSH